MNKRAIIRWDEWFLSPAGFYLLTWEQKQLDHMVANVFGYYAIQLGLPQIKGLKESRISAQWYFAEPELHHLSSGSDFHLSGHMDALPFASESLDLIVLPHALEQAIDPHSVLREVDRVLRPEGKLILTGINPHSLWGIKKSLENFQKQACLPSPLHSIAFSRVKDWLTLLGYDIDRGRFGCYRWPSTTEEPLQKQAFLEKAGDRWWPSLGASYIIQAVKRRPGPTWVGRIAKKRASISLLGELVPLKTTTIYSPPPVAPQEDEDA